VVEQAAFTRRVEDFTCLHCGRAVRGSGYTNHCPACLWSQHVDVSPGDRAESCGGLMEPIAVVFEHGEYVIGFRCTKCSHRWRNKAGAADSREALHALMGRPFS
jgi:DNA-directed RNA polymerase subunit RPC12/RpoP